ncbi:hypothetical protein [Dapis sp. BLCC M172]|uniref:hypothetical protein n=1 Tax=Dapis sp. BLCC M172 TaxID=2975281 RepID=UPI003CEF524B
MRRDFLGASENDNIDDFGLKRDEWKDLMREKPVFLGSSHKMKVFLILLLGKIPEYQGLSTTKKI